MSVPQPSSRSLAGVVVSAGKMMKTVKVRIMKQQWNKYIRKYFSAPLNLLVHDPNDSCREGDVVHLQSGKRYSRRVKHVVDQIISPFGAPLDERPPVPSTEERQKVYEGTRAAKLERRQARMRDFAEKGLRPRQGRLGKFESSGDGLANGG